MPLLKARSNCIIVAWNCNRRMCEVHCKPTTMHDYLKLGSSKFKKDLIQASIVQVKLYMLPEICRNSTPDISI